MFFSFMDELRSAGISVSLKEHLLLLEALHHQVIDQSPEEFYYLSRATLVKDEGLLDRFDQVFAKVFKGLETTFQGNDSATIPEDWLKAVAEKFLSEEEMEKIKSLGSWEEIMETLKKLLHTGLSHRDNPFVELAINTCDEIRGIIETAIDDGSLAQDDVFDREYRPRNEQGLQRFDTRFNDFADARIRPVLDRFWDNDGQTYGAVIGNQDGYLPTHISARSHAPTGDPHHDATHCRNRIKMLDRTTSEAITHKNDRYYAAVYRFEPTASDGCILRNIFVPLWIKGRYWGNFELAYIR
jgi:hypothetical protein